jgi:hypothetical protein
MTADLIALEKATALVVALFVAGFGLQVIGAIVVALEIRNDVRTARRVAAELEWENVDPFPAFVGERLSRRLWPRVVGLILVLMGALLGLAANLLALE